MKLTRKVVFIEGEDERMIKAAAYFLRNGNIRPVLLGNEITVTEQMKKLNMNTTVTIIDPSRNDYIDTFIKRYQSYLGEGIHNLCRPNYFGCMLLDSGYVDGLVGGAVLPTADILRPAIQIVGRTDSSTVISGSIAMYLPRPMPAGQTVLLFSDCAVVPEPNEEQLISIGFNAANIARTVFGLVPKVAYLSYSTKGSASQPIVLKMRTASEKLKQKLPDVSIDGELQADAALIPTISTRKAPDSVLKGDANVLIFPDLNAGNIAYKLVERIARAKTLGVILEGFRKPVNDLSRGCSVDDIINTVCVTVLQTQSARNVGS